MFLHRLFLFVGIIASMIAPSWGQPLSVDLDISGHVVAGTPAQPSVSATVANPKYHGFVIAGMSKYVPGVDVISPTGGTGTPPTYLVTNTQVSNATVNTAGTGGATSTNTTVGVFSGLTPTILPVASISGFSNGDTVDIQLNSAYCPVPSPCFFETTISGVPSGSNITLSMGIPGGNTTTGNAVYKAQTVTGTTGTGTKFTASVAIASGGVSQVLQIHGGNYTANPTGCAGTSCNEPVTGAGLTGAVLTVNTGALTLSQQTAGAMTVLPPAAGATTSTGAGVGAILSINFTGAGVIDALGYLQNGVLVAAASSQTTAAGPITQTTVKMAGLAGSITPVFSGTVLLTISGDMANASGIGEGVQVQASYGTGTAPTSATAVTGTQCGGLQKYNSSTTGGKVPFSVNCLITGMTVGTAYWLDLTEAQVAGGTASISDVSVSAIEVH